MYSVAVLLLVLAIGTESMHRIEGWSYVDSFYFISLIATTQGPTATPHTDAGKIFAALMAFVSVGAVISSVAFVFGPLFGTVFSLESTTLRRKRRKYRRG